MERDEVFTIIHAIILKKLGVDDPNFTGSSKFRDDLGADSIDMVDIVMAVEKAYDISLPDIKYNEMADGTVDGFVDAIYSIVTNKE